MGWDVSATLPAPHLTVEERKYWDWNDMLFLKCIGFIVGIFLMLEGNKDDYVQIGIYRCLK